MNTDPFVPLEAPPSYDQACPNFHQFPTLPAEIRARIWEASLKPRIVRWTRTKDQNLFTTPERCLALMLVSTEAREAAFLYGGYKNLTNASNPVYFSPTLDYFWLDPGWTEIGKSSNMLVDDPLKELLPSLGNVEKIMIHPNWSGQRRNPTVLFGQVHSCRQVLIAADEKSIVAHGKVMLETVKEVKSYYASLEKQGLVREMPSVSVGCLGWVGDERRRMHHGSEDNRQLVNVFENQWDINSHLHRLRQEEWHFTRNHFSRLKIVHKLRFAREGRTDEKTF